MSIHRERYLSGAAFYVRTIRRKGREHRVFDRSIRWRAVARRMRARGMTTLEIAITLRRSRTAIERVLDFAWQFN